jgi:anti-anti-sigma factor
MMTKNVMTFSPAGRLDGVMSNDLRQNILESLHDDTHIVLIDLKEVSFMNSSALGSLIRTKKAVQNLGKDFYICSANEQVKIILELTRMDLVLNPFSDRAEFEQKILHS